MLDQAGPTKPMYAPHASFGEQRAHDSAGRLVDRYGELDTDSGDRGAGGSREIDDRECATVADEPVLAVGMTPEAAARELWAATTGNGVTGFVAATGKSYLCEDTSEDPLYIEGAKGARSSLTVPVMLHDTVTGTLNVESPEPRAFSDSDLQFLEIFARDVAIALNTLELLAAEKASTAAASVEAIHSAVALPVGTIRKLLGGQLLR